ncbi:MAG TPA: alpha/beta fold hydrolase [Myxococcota bacterium]
MPTWKHLDPGAFDLHVDSDVGAVVLHGFSGSPTEIRGLSEHLAAQGIGVHAPLLPGHGLHHRDLEKAVRRDWLDAARAALDVVRRRHRRVVVVGQSMGGLLALSLAAEATDLVAVVTLAPALAVSRLAQLSRISSVLPRFIPKFEERRPDLVDVAQLKEVWSYTHTPLRAVREVLALASDVHVSLPKVTAPLLVVQGARDKTVRPISSRRVIARAGSTTKELLWLDGTGHIVAVDAERERVWQRVAGFIAERRAG